MEYRCLGNSGLQVSVLGLGGLTFGSGRGMMAGISTDEAESRRILDRAVEAGITLLDTADVYQEGESEAILGRWLRQRGGRERLVLASKVGGSSETCPGGLSRAQVVAACEGSLRRLQTEVIDLYQLHWPDIETPLEETLEAMEQLRRQGKIRAVGCSNYPAWLMGEALALCRQAGFAPLCAAQLQYNLLVRHIEREILPLCQRAGVAVLPWSPLAGGLLSGKYPAGAWPARHGRMEAWRRRYGADQGRVSRVVETVTRLARRRGCSPAALALGWLRGRPAVASCIIGARTLAQLEQNLEGADLSLAEEERQELEQVSALAPEYPTAQYNRAAAGGPFWD